MMTPQEVHGYGLTLADALEKYGNRRKFHSQSYTPPHPVIEKVDKQQEAIEALPRQLANLADALMEPGRRRSDVADDFKRRLAAGKLAAVGYVSPRSIDDAPRSIPPDIWPLAKLNFDKSEIQCGSLKFENVRIFKLPKNSEIGAPAKLRLVHSTDIALPRPTGRPSSRDQILAAYQMLKSAGEIDFSKPMTHAHAKIRALLIQQHHTERGFQKEAIRLAVREDFQATADARKPARKL